MSSSLPVVPPLDASTAPTESTGGTNINRAVSDSVLSYADLKNERHGTVMDLRTGNELSEGLLNSSDEDEMVLSTAQIGGMIHNDEIKSTADICGIIWRKFFRWILVVTADPQNALRFTRELQVQHYLSPHEAFLLGDVIKALDAVQNSASSKSKEKEKARAKLNDTLREALKNRNVGRELFQRSGILDLFWHIDVQLANFRKCYAGSRLIFLGPKFSFPPSSENFLASKSLAVNSILRHFLGPGKFLTRFVTDGREEFIVDDVNANAQNLAAESTGFEVSMRNQFRNYFGRKRIDEFRTDNRLPTDESVLLTFHSQPGPTMINNGVVHTLSVVGKHWKSSLDNPVEILDINVWKCWMFVCSSVFICRLFC